MDIPAIQVVRTSDDTNDATLSLSVGYPWRRLKTASSKRQVPLVGASLRAAQRIKDAGSAFTFPKYCSEVKCNANSASATLNKWLKPRVLNRCVIHSFRHSLRDRLRAIECPADIIDAIGGWTTEGVGHQYGQGHSLSVMHGWMGKLSAFRLVSSKIN